MKTQVLVKFETKMRKHVQVDSRRMSKYMDWVLVCKSRPVAEACTWVPMVHDKKQFWRF